MEETKRPTSKFKLIKGFSNPSQTNGLLHHIHLAMDSGGKENSILLMTKPTKVLVIFL